MRRFTLVLGVVSLLACSAFAADITWEGLNYNGTPRSTATDINDGANWSSGSAPGAGDSAIFSYSGSATSSEMGDLFIDASATNFNPDGSFTFNANNNPDGWRQTSDLYLDKSLTLSGDLVTNGSPGSSGRQNYRLRIGTQTPGVTVNIGGSLTTNTTSWDFFMLGTGDENSGNETVLNFTGNATFATPASTYGNYFALTSSAGIENVTYDKAPQMQFSGVGATITLQSGGKRNTGTIGLGDVSLNVRSDQTWACDATAFVSMYSSIGASVTVGEVTTDYAGKYLVNSIDGGDLNNLDQLNIRLNSAGESSTVARAMRLMAGEYGSLWMNSANTSGKNQYLNQTGNVTFKGKAVDFDVNGDPVQTEYGLILRNDAGNSDANILFTNGYALTIENGLKLADDGPATTAAYNIKSQALNAAGSVVVVGGNVLMIASDGRDPEAPAIGNLAATGVGIEGGAGGSLTVGGSWDVRVVSRTGTNQSDSTVTLTGDAATYEVADAASLSGVQTNSWSVKTLNIGTAGDAATIQLVNDYINDNPVTGDADVDKIGEKLIVGTLNIDANSTLDVNGQVVEISPTTLIIDSTGTLDMNTGEVLTDGQILTNFYGLTDQTAEWNALASQVIDSDNPTFDFTAVYNAGDDATYWQAVAVPEPATMGLLAFGGIALLKRRKA